MMNCLKERVPNVEQYMILTIQSALNASINIFKIKQHDYHIKLYLGSTV